mgnify:CR=1 FL=1
MHMEIMKMDRHEIKEILTEALQESSHFQVHEAHHEWIQLRIDNEKARNTMCREITSSIIQWSVVGIIGFFIVWIKEHYLP